MQITVVTLQEFTAEHGEYIDVAHDGVRGTVYERLFLDGAVAHTDPDGQMTSHQEPPADMYDRTRSEVIFLKHKVRREEAEWDRFRLGLGQDANFAVANLSLPPISDKALDELDAGKFRIFEIRQQIAACEEVLANSPEAVAKREQAEVNRLEIQRRQEQLDRLMGIVNTAQVPPTLTPARIQELKEGWGHLPRAKVESMFGKAAADAMFGITAD